MIEAKRAANKSEPGLQHIRCALISVSDKTGLESHASALAKFGVHLVSTGGTHQALARAGLDVEEVSHVTDFPEMMDGRLKTLHPRVHGGLLARRDLPEHTDAMEAHAIPAIDLLYVNLYPFEQAVARGAPFEECIENIDIGGPAMIRAAAKNFDFVVVATDAEDMTSILVEMQENKGQTTYALRKKLAAKAYARTAAYDAAISNWFAVQTEDPAPTWRAFGGRLRQGLRYGENPHQVGAFYTEGPPRFGVATARQIGGRELSYINILDADAAFELVAEFDPKRTPAVAIIKHANPCGVAEGKTLLEAYLRAYECDRDSRFGGIIAFNQTLDGEAAEEIAKMVTDVIIAPDADKDALAFIAKRRNRSSTPRTAPPSVSAQGK
jgi:phosphoribosylaminoimidazolecarboxamide formyltransferase/IMP cyclohydrolase